jgi:phosphatidate cytidylyltransferase
MNFVCANAALAAPARDPMSDDPMAGQAAPSTAEIEAEKLRTSVQRAAALRLRVMSAVVLAPLVLVVTLIGGWAFAVLVAAAGLVMVFEWSRVIDGAGITRDSILHALIVVVVAGMAGAGYPGLALVATACGTLAAVGLATERHHAARWPILGTPYVAVPIIALIWLRGFDEQGLRHMIWLLALVWATDTAAYSVGRSFGGPKLAPSISPNKTWSGFIGGIVAAGLVGAVAAKLADRTDVMEMVFLSAFIAVWAELGDLAESALKRGFQVKDTGSLIPGHGGMLDRLDSLLFAAPIAALWLFAQGEGSLP